MTVRVCFEFGIAIRKSALPMRALSREAVLHSLETLELYSEDDQLMIFGPSFGPEACDELVRRLTKLGLQYFDDFFDLRLDHPPWLEFIAQQPSLSVNSR